MYLYRSLERSKMHFVRNNFTFFCWIQNKIYSKSWHSNTNERKIAFVMRCIYSSVYSTNFIVLPKRRDARLRK